MGEISLKENQVWHISVRWSKHEKCLGWDDHETAKLFFTEYCDKWIFQKEDTEDNLHYQGTGHLKERTRAKGLAKRVNTEFFGINIQPASTNGIKALQKYCMKDETRVAGPWADREIYMGEDLPTKLWPWQERLKQMIYEKPDNRTIHWVVDKEGNHGKSDFCKLMAFKHDCLTLEYGNAGDLKNLIFKYPNKKAYLFDLTRCKPSLFSSEDIYSVMESCKNGYILNTKYETGMLFMKRPHVIVFANVAPNTEKLTEDRWKIQRFMGKESLARLVTFIPEESRIAQGELPAGPGLIPSVMAGTQVTYDRSILKRKADRDDIDIEDVI
jgi:hypothetical protein